MKRIVSLVCWGVLLLTGCSGSRDGRPRPVPVTGYVLVDGEPLEGTRVVFSPDDHQYAAAGVTDAEGRFQLQTFAANDGAVPGSYKIIASNFIVIEHPNGSVTETHYLPAMYRDPAKSGLTATVEDRGPNELTLELTIPASGIEQPKLPAN
ncbi:hypothetical protein [Schlesneria sp. T3-172]|uniref:hypothetical protein n=1 Tax=Schlesneria TaxID=656899 RepID=UPI002F1D5E13